MLKKNPLIDPNIRPLWEELLNKDRVFRDNVHTYFQDLNLQKLHHKKLKVSFLASDYKLHHFELYVSGEQVYISDLTSEESQK
ncbi:hypothetical protein [Leptospira sarikeiensis]|uniref:Uncharacterized protein n=1 Tax=Leptospira sarikeiensis TaxID=2484943 RepID=A0A4R9K595_9LEPT|nr:hypothetical protein [Leptospira sarikeiensis]TGL60447.1 hypothetical protein EHQ64_11430 [Leptospira sarikeiensis]